MNTLENILKGFTTETGLNINVVDKIRKYRGCEPFAYKAIEFVYDGELVEMDLATLTVAIEMEKVKTGKDLAFYFGL